MSPFINDLEDADVDEEQPTLDPTPFIDVPDLQDEDYEPTPEATSDEESTAHDELLCPEDMPVDYDEFLFKRFHEHFTQVQQKFLGLERITGDHGNEHLYSQLAQQYFDLLHNTSSHIDYIKMSFVKKANPYIPTIWYAENEAGKASTCYECLKAMGICICHDFNKKKVDTPVDFHKVLCIDMPVRPMTLDEALTTECPEKCLVTNVGTLFKEGTYFPCLRACRRLLAHHVAYAYYGQGVPSNNNTCCCQICKHYDENSIRNRPIYKPLVIDGECEMQGLAMRIVEEEDDITRKIKRCRDDCRYSPYTV